MMSQEPTSFAPINKNRQADIQSMASASLVAVSEQRLFILRGVEYLAVAETNIPSFASIIDSQTHEQVSLLTILRPDPNSPVNVSTVRSLVDDSVRHDDVWTKDFLQGIIVVSDQNPGLHEGQFSSSFSTRWISWLSGKGPAGLLSPGPYVLWNKELCKAHRVYDDVQASFIMANKPRRHSDRQFEQLRLNGRYYTSLAVAVPSRFQLHTDNAAPLSGLRFAIKDIFDLQGLKVTLGDRAYYNQVHTANRTAPIVQRLIDAGANLVGTLKLASFITKEEPTESQDFHAPFNPRADGYQSAWSSSGGSGAAIASYNWLDFTLGSDTTGSSRRPAMANGVFQLRISSNTISFEGMAPAWKRFDAPAIFARDITILEKGAAVWISTAPINQSPPKKPISIVVPTDFPVKNDKQQALIEAFVADLEAATGTQRNTISLAELWKRKLPHGIATNSLEDYLKDTGINGFCRGFFDEYKSFFEDYRASSGRAAYSNPVVRYRLALGQNVTNEQYDTALQRLDIYKAWLLDHVLEAEKDTIPLVVLPITTQAVDYRDVPPPLPSPPVAFDGVWMAPVLGSPELSVPIGELEYYSERSLRDENLP